MRINLTLAIAFLGVGALLVWVGFTDPPGGLVQVVGDTLTGKRTPGAGKKTSAAAAALLPAGPTTPQQQYAASVIAPSGPTTPQQVAAAAR